MEERLQKLLARAGFGSRRACEELIRQGRVTVNGEVAQLGQKADLSRDDVALNGHSLRVDSRRIYVALYKPPGVLSDEGNKSGRVPIARDLVSLEGHVFPVGRLDLRSEGLMLFTNDGELAHLLAHPRYEHSKEYHVCVEGHPEEGVLHQWRSGVYLDDRKTAPAEVSLLRREGECTWLRVVLREGRKRQIRRVAALLGHPVQWLIRVRIGPVRLGELKPGEWRYLSQREVEQLEELKAQKAS
ncbi:MAG: hypothetical protein A2Y73_09325 [Chloroflexi bacterium RBG_13_56_8]|nr:MAG: hypothetical protein A2Y73_09325 [Chloroflexi bacterium RBG_13_56_8]